MINTVQKYIFFLRLASFIAFLTIIFGIIFIIKFKTRKNPFSGCLQEICRLVR